MLLHQGLERSAQRIPDKIALVCGAERLTYGALQGRVGTLANTLTSDGVVRGDRVLVMLENGIEYAVAVHAVAAAGAVLVPVHPLTKADKLAFIARDTRARALLTHASLAPSWRNALEP